MPEVEPYKAYEEIASFPPEKAEFLQKLSDAKADEIDNAKTCFLTSVLLLLASVVSVRLEIDDEEIVYIFTNYSNALMCACGGVYSLYVSKKIEKQIQKIKKGL